ncbi:hypothetical protein TUM17580_42000 [Citrobacter farmeri]|uniref:competence protein CoiA n=1 Tax=Citrobacter farmeri TaxID=67824 RepID=UPI001E2DAE9A|nr:competence protein CoiA family protein [Citrobacter farmeri]GJL48141.1 hypothetical protein TUM17580_42000 [Citrobacter farmeri]
MLTARNHGLIVFAARAQKADAPFNCPECGKEVTLKKGVVMTHHFAHKPPVTCYYGAGESELHRKAKLEIFESLQGNGFVTEVELEKSFGDVRADVFAIIKGTPVAIEVQRSTLTPIQIYQRTASYFQKGIYVLWLGLPDKRHNEDRFIPKWWEKWIHAAYFGQAFYWYAREFVTPVKFGTATTYVEATDWGGGYTRTLKRYKVPHKGKAVSIVDAFGPKIGAAWSGSTFSLPDRRIFTQV